MLRQLEHRYSIDAGPHLMAKEFRSLFLRFRFRFMLPIHKVNKVGLYHSRSNLAKLYHPLTLFYYFFSLLQALYFYSTLNTPTSLEIPDPLPLLIICELI